MSKPTIAYIGLGSNLGDRNQNIDKALELLSEVPKTKVTKTSDIIETEPLGRFNQPKYLNCVAQLTTELKAETLFEKVRDIENLIGRQRGQVWAPRTIDLDILLFGDEIINSPELEIPHSQMHLRSFVLKGLSQLNPQLEHPVLKESVSELASRLNGRDFFLNPGVTQLVSVAGIIGVGKTTLAEKLAKIFRGRLLLEPYDTNPFMPEVYAGKKEMALNSQMFFLTNRTEQLNPDVLVPGKIAFSDYIFEKELIYANLLLSKQQLEKYMETYPSYAVKVAKPVMVIYLTDTTQNCLQRIHDRNRPYEQKIELEFLEKLSSDYDKLFADWKASPLMCISMSKFDCKKQNDVDHLTNQLKSYIASAEGL